jgi:hypothetical protein
MVAGESWRKESYRCFEGCVGLHTAILGPSPLSNSATYTELNMILQTPLWCVCRNYDVHLLSNERLAALATTHLYRGRTPYSDSNSTSIKSSNNIKIFVCAMVPLLSSADNFVS